MEKIVLFVNPNNAGASFRISPNGQGYRIDTISSDMVEVDESINVPSLPSALHIIADRMSILSRLPFDIVTLIG